MLCYTRKQSMHWIDALKTDEDETQLFWDTEKQGNRSTSNISAGYHSQWLEAASVCADLQSCTVEVDRLWRQVLLSSFLFLNGNPRQPPPTALFLISPSTSIISALDFSLSSPSPYILCHRATTTTQTYHNISSDSGRVKPFTVPTHHHANDNTNATANVVVWVKLLLFFCHFMNFNFSIYLHCVCPCAAVTPECPFFGGINKGCSYLYIKVESDWSWWQQQMLSGHVLQRKICTFFH